jgi:response regulator RpfG family c-di-GMP phosphodiesterase
LYHGSWKIMDQVMLNHLNTPVLVLQDPSKLIISVANSAALNLLFGVEDAQNYIGKSLFDTAPESWIVEQHPLLYTLTTCLNLIQEEIDRGDFNPGDQNLVTKVVFSFGDKSVYQVQTKPLTLQALPKTSCILVEAANITDEIEATGSMLRADRHGFMYSRPTGTGKFYTSRVSDNILNMLEISSEEFFSEGGFINFVHPGDKQVILDRDIRQQNGEKVESVRVRLIAKSGQTKICNLSCTSSIIGGKVAQITTVVHDISEQVRLENDLIEARKLAQDAIMKSPIGQMILKRNGDLVLINPKAQESIHEFTQTVLHPGLNFFEIAPDSETILMYKEIIERVYDKDIVEVHEMEYENPDNTEDKHWYNIVFVKVRDGLEGVLMMVQETTDSKKKLELIAGRTEYLLSTMATAIELREATDGGTVEHIHRVSQMIEEICRKMGFEDDIIRVFKAGARGHDIGKIGWSDEILFGGKLLEGDARNALISHIITWVQMMGNSTDPFIQAICYCINHHHQDWNGKGYPKVKRIKNGLRVDEPLEGQEIPLEARIFRLIDSWDAMRSLDRKYKSHGFGPYTTMMNLIKGAFIQYDPHITVVVIDYLLENYKKYNYGIPGGANLENVEINTKEEVLEELQSLRARIDKNVSAGNLPASDIDEQVRGCLIRNPELIDPRNILSYYIKPN